MTVVPQLKYLCWVSWGHNLRKWKTKLLTLLFFFLWTKSKKVSLLLFLRHSSHQKAGWTKSPSLGSFGEQLDSGVTVLQFTWYLIFFTLIESDADTRLWTAPLVFLSISQHQFHQAARVKNCYLHLKWYLLVIRGNASKNISVCTLSCCSLITNVEGQRGNYLPHW